MQDVVSGHFSPDAKISNGCKRNMEVNCACREGGEASGAWFAGCLLRLDPRMFARDALQTLQMHSQGSIVFTSVSPKVAKSNR